MKAQNLKNEIETNGTEAYTSAGLVVKYLKLADVKTFDMSQTNGGRGTSQLYICENNAGNFEVHDDQGRFCYSFPVTK